MLIGGLEDSGQTCYQPLLVGNVFKYCMVLRLGFLKSKSSIVSYPVEAAMEAPRKISRR
jgi:hypothetical protein